MIHFDRGPKTANFFVLVKATGVGILCCEAVYFAKIIGEKFNQFVADNSYDCQATVIFIIVSCLILAYLIYRGFFSKLWAIIKSLRLDLGLLFLAGIFVSISFGGIGNDYYLKFSQFSIWQILILVSLPIISIFALLLREILLFVFRKKDVVPFFVSDSEQKSKNDDLLEFAQQAERFAERIFNEGSPDSLVFGIDAPWGIGKSSFVNFCREYWENNRKQEVIIYNFNPLRYENRNNLLEKFIDGLVRVIQKNIFVPEIKPLISKYSRFIKDAKGSFSILGVDISMLLNHYSIDDVLEDLETVLSSLNRKIIIIVDDLDRLNFSEIQDVLFTIKKGFTLPNISYVLCYDSDNINVLETRIPNSEKVTEFLEKFVNVKIGIYLDNKMLSSFISDNLSKVLDGNSQSDPVLITQATGGLLDIYKSKDYHLYFPFVGDIRKLKRLINIIILLEVERTDFDNSDFEKQDLIHLLLIYINYPNIFRKIYNTETGKTSDGTLKRGFFSLIISFDDDYPTEGKNPLALTERNAYKNSVKYTKYLNTLTENQQFLLNKIFAVSQRLENPHIDDVPEEIKKTYACFNGDGGWTGGRNLEEYLNLIVKLAKPQKQTQFRFYLKCRDSIRSGKAVESVLSQEQFNFSQGENSHEQFWRLVTNSNIEFERLVAVNIITYLLQNITSYSLFTNKDVGVGFRDDLALYLVIMLDRMGWSDQNGKHQVNSEENVAEIAEWIFGENRHQGYGILETLGKEERGVAGFYDLLRFRLFCSADRGGDMFNVQLALSKHGDFQAPTQGSIRDIAVAEMREISQRTFQIFKNHYIDKNKNFFTEVDSLSLKDLSGQFYDFVTNKIDSGDIKDSDITVEELKSLIKIFSIYQLGHFTIGHGVGCGYYDATGKEDKHGINNDMNDYLFNVCFNPGSTTSYECFLDYLLTNFVGGFAFGERQNYVPNINEFTKVLQKDRLIEYWKTNGDAIKSLNLTNKEKKIITVNYTASYKHDLNSLYQVLDELISPPTVVPDIVI